MKIAPLALAVVLPSVPLVLILALTLSGCAATQMAGVSAQGIAAIGPTIMNAQVIPKTIELNRDLQPTTQASIIADVKDFKSKVVDVKLRFIHVPVEIPMENIGGTTWGVQISADQLRTLAIAGRTITYEANIVAQNENGRTTITSHPLSITIQTPEISQPSAPQEGNPPK